MKKQDEAADTKTDLKHDTMEFSANTDGDDAMDTDDESYEEEDISADELDAMEDDDDDSEAAALNAEEIDRLADEDNLPEEDWVEDLPDTGEDNEENQR
jgi:hypothetical protein